ncbi:MAG: hypothetical protein IJQ39_09380 [Thermoguttaceae bacterium]|nr:hypothetical protein [Thermoguttaceae bacterium]
MKPRFILLIVLSLLCLTSNSASAAELKILVPGDCHCKAYQVAGQELQKYWNQITGQTLEIVNQSNGEDSYLVIGSDAVNPFVRQLVERKVIRDFPLKTASDDFRLLTVKDGARTHLILAGGRGRSTLYAVYCFLEMRGGCRWFWDSDVVPHQDAIDITGLDVTESPRFYYRGMRYFAHRGLRRFQAEHWSLDDWKQEIDWLVKKRQNIFMLRIGMDDLFQKAFPDVVDYPDPSKPLPEALTGYNNRTLFWSLQYRGQLRKALLQYAFDRDLMHPEDFGTMTHWYSRTPKQFLDKVKPEFLDKITNLSGKIVEQTNQVWDIHKDEYLDYYWKLTQAHIDNYGKAELFHTIATAERLVINNDPGDDVKLKKYVFRRLTDSLRSRYPNGQLLLVGWDFIFWKPQDVRECISHLDPNNTVLWCYEADTKSDRNFTNWDVIGKFPYTFGIFQAYESAMDIRGNYPRIEERMAKVVNDPFCRGYILWPENSHSDIFLLNYFTANSWKPGKTTDELLTEFCRDRYGDQSDKLLTIWRDVLPISQMLDWSGNFWSQAFSSMNGKVKPQDANVWRTSSQNQIPRLQAAPQIFTRLAEVEWSTPFVYRDSIDLARTTLDRMLTCARVTLFAAMNDWREGKISTEQARVKVNAFYELAEAMRDTLALHSDYSICETVEGMNAVEPIVNPDFDRVILDNASCEYCQSHQYELMQTWYLPCIKTVCDWATDRLDRDDKSAFTYPDSFKKVVTEKKAELLATPLKDQRPTLERTQENFKAAMLRAAKAASEVLK